jgi:protein gp37
MEATILPTSEIQRLASAGQTTKIEWATHTRNDQAGCTKVSPACKFCYALRGSVRQANFGTERYKTVTNGDLSNPKWSGKVVTDLDVRRAHFKDVRNAMKTRYTFYGSMTDLFHESLDLNGEALYVLAEEVEKLGDCKVPQVLMLLTKRPERMLVWQQTYFPNGLPGGVWVGVTAEDQAHADKRIPYLSLMKADVRFISAEPLVGPVSIRPAWTDTLEWVITGGESGHGARKGNPDWFRGLRDDAVNADIPFFFKQWGAFNEFGVRVGKKASGRVLDGETWSERPPAVKSLWTPSSTVGSSGITLPKPQCQMDYATKLAKATQAAKAIIIAALEEKE